MTANPAPQISGIVTFRLREGVSNAEAAMVGAINAGTMTVRHQIIRW